VSLDLERARTYEKKKCLTLLAHLALEVVLLLVLINMGITHAFKRWAVAVAGSFHAQVAIYYGAFFLSLWILELLFGFYSGFYLEHTFRLSNQSLGHWFVEFLKKTLLSFALSLALVLGLYSLIQAFPDHWWIFAWLGFAGVSYLLGQLFPVLIVPLFYRYGRITDEGLKERILALVDRYHLPVENVYSLNLSKTTKKANAMFAGLGRTKRLVLSDTLIENFTGDEIESIVAHELGHFKHRDIWHHLGFQLVVSFAGFALLFRLLQALAPQLGYSGQEDLAAFPLFYLSFFVFTTLLMPASHAYSRWREREADRFALKAVGPAGFIPAMEKLARLNLANPRPHPVVEWWFYTHPPIAKRIEMAERIR